MKRFILLILTVLMLFQMGCGAEESTEPVAEMEITETENVEEAMSSEDETKERVEEDTDEEEFDYLDYVKAVLPDPSLYMIRPYEEKTESDGVQTIVFCLEEYEETLAFQYLEYLLDGDYFMEEIETYRGESDTARLCSVYLAYTGDEQIEVIEGLEEKNCHVAVNIYTEKGNETNMTIVCSTDFYLMTSGEHADQSLVVYPEPESEPEPESIENKPEGSASPSSKELPDLRYFLNTSGSSPHSDDGGMQYGFQEIPLEYKETLKNELLTLLQEDRYQLKLISSYRNDLTKNTYNEIYEFTYTGTSGLTPLSGETDGCHVLLLFGSYTKKDNLKIIINYSKEFELTDPGERTSLVVEAGGSFGGGGDIGNWDPEQPEFTKKDCFTCDGDGKCTRCNGYGYIWRNDIKSDCTRCSNGRCPTCNGSGKRD